ncbi:cytochrome P450 [Imleria badia]|nr:cytochrome P450 [Imleria badia]
MERSISSVLLVLLMVVTVEIIRRILRNRIERKGYPLPPVPGLFPFLGSILSSNPQEPCSPVGGWREMYGECNIVYIRFLGTDVVVLNSTSVASELLEKRSRMYSDRPVIPSAIPYGHDINFGLSRYNEHWRLCRRIFQQTFRADAAHSLCPTQRRRARQLIVNIIDNPEEYPSHFAMFSFAGIASAVYDYEPSPRNDPMLSVVNKYISAASRGLSFQMASLFMLCPFILHIPDWLPGSWIKREAKEAYAWRNKMVETLYRDVRERMESTNHINASLVSDHITRMETFDGSYRSEYETALKHTSATALFVGFETTRITIMAFTLAMVENPHVWKRAQEEIDAVVGMDRLPEFDDRPSLPYIDAIMREVLRWRPVLPLGTPHAATQSDIYEGYYIPKGAIVITNIWAMSRDEVRYPDADKFMPERFLNAEGMLTDDDPGDFAFGFGRRRCPGRHNVDVSLWGAIATMLATLDFNLAKDADGNDITFKATYKQAITSQTNPFPCRLTPRPHVDKEVLQVD